MVGTDKECRVVWFCLQSASLDVTRQFDHALIDGRSAPVGLHDIDNPAIDFVNFGAAAFTPVLQ